MKYTLLAGAAIFFLSACGNGTDVQTETTTLAQDSLIFKDSAGNSITLSDLENFSGKVGYEILDDIEVSAEANRLHQEGRRLGAEGKYEESIEKLMAAMKLQPDWAYPPYDLAYTYSLKGDDANALKYYEITDSLRPHGFFTCKTALWSLRAERDGKFPAGSYMTYMQIEWAETENEKIQIASMIVDTLPDYAPAWMELGHLLNSEAERLKAIEMGLGKNPDPETKGIMLINKAAILEQQGAHDEAVSILCSVIFDPEATGSNVALAKSTLKSFY